MMKNYKRLYQFAIGIIILSQCWEKNIFMLLKFKLNNNIERVIIDKLIKCKDIGLVKMLSFLVLANLLYKN